MKATHHRKGGASIRFDEHELETLETLRMVLQMYIRTAQSKEENPTPYDAEWYAKMDQYLNDLKHEIKITA